MSHSRAFSATPHSFARPGGTPSMSKTLWQATSHAFISSLIHPTPHGPVVIPIVCLSHHWGWRSSPFTFISRSIPGGQLSVRQSNPGGIGSKAGYTPSMLFRNFSQVATSLSFGRDNNIRFTVIMLRMLQLRKDTLHPVISKDIGIVNRTQDAT